MSFQRGVITVTYFVSRTPSEKSTKAHLQTDRDMSLPAVDPAASAVAVAAAGWVTA